MLPSLNLGTGVLYHIHTIITIILAIIIFVLLFPTAINIIIIGNCTIISIIIIINEWDEQYLSQHEALNPTCP